MILLLKCKPQVFFFLKKQYGEQMKLSETDTVSSFIFNTLIHNRSNSFHDNKLKNYTCYYPIKISNYMYDKHSIKKFSSLSTRAINKYIDTLFELAFYLFMMHKIHVDELKKKSAIEEFMQLYNIDEDIYSFEALNKDYFRFEKGDKKEIEKMIKKIPVHLS